MNWNRSEESSIIHNHVCIVTSFLRVWLWPKWLHVQSYINSVTLLYSTLQIIQGNSVLEIVYYFQPSFLIACCLVYFSVILYKLCIIIINEALVRDDVTIFAVCSSRELSWLTGRIEFHFFFSRLSNVFSCWFIALVMGNMCF